MSTSNVTESETHQHRKGHAVINSLRHPSSSTVNGLATENIELVPVPSGSHVLPLGLGTGPPPNVAARNEIISLACLCWCIFLAGFNDGTLGPLLPRIQEHFSVGFTVVSLLFIASAIVWPLLVAKRTHITYMLPGFHLRCSD